MTLECQSLRTTDLFHSFKIVGVSVGKATVLLRMSLEDTSSKNPATVILSPHCLCPWFPVSLHHTWAAGSQALAEPDSFGWESPLENETKGLCNVNISHAFGPKNRYCMCKTGKILYGRVCEQRPTNPRERKREIL